jgi:8-oxo-dGTP pyrophosphatase MutT (NUDIX family)
MSINLSIFNNRIPKLDSIEYCKTYSVLAPIIKTNHGDQLLFQVRSDNLSSQPSEICFPGGKIEAGELNIDAATRETCEELKINLENIQVIGELDTVTTPFNTIIYPFIGYITNYNNTYNTNEVKEIFYVPLKWILETEPLLYTIDVEIKPDSKFPFQMIQHGEKYPWAKGKYHVHFYEYGDKIIWGITARMVKNISDILKAK